MRESDRCRAPMKLGNSGGGKRPDFWHAFEEGKDRGLAMSPQNAGKDQEPSEKALS